jgi:hypothetical protein
MVDYVDGTMVEREQERDNSSSGSTAPEEQDDSDQMDDHMSKMIYIVAVFVPLAFVLLACVAFGVYVARNNVNWNKKGGSQNSVWQRYHPKSKELRKVAMDEVKMGDGDIPDDTSELSWEEASVQAAVRVGKKTKKRLES